MESSYTPSTVSLGNLSEAAAAGVNLALADQVDLAIGEELGPTMGMYAAEP